MQPAAAIAIRIDSTSRTQPAGKVADAELIFPRGPLQGLKLTGFGIWTRNYGQGLNVTFPARAYQVNGERRSFALLRPTGETAGMTSSPSDRLRDLILDAYRRTQDSTSDPATWTYDLDGQNLDDQPARQTPAMLSHLETLGTIISQLAQGQTPALEPTQATEDGSRTMGATPIPGNLASNTLDGAIAQAINGIEQTEPYTPARAQVKQAIAQAIDTQIGQGPRYDYDRQAWIGADGRYLSCQHPAEMQCQCYGRLHAGEVAQAETATPAKALDAALDAAQAIAKSQERPAPTLTVSPAAQETISQIASDLEKARTIGPAALADEIWPSFTSNERAGVRMGIFPAEKMEAAEKRLSPQDRGRYLAVALMDLAAKEPRPVTPTRSTPTRTTTRRAPRF